MMIAAAIIVLSFLSVLGSIPETIGVIAVGAFLVIATVIVRRLGSRDAGSANRDLQHLTESN